MRWFAISNWLVVSISRSSMKSLSSSMNEAIWSTSPVELLSNRCESESTPLSVRVETQLDASMALDLLAFGWVELAVCWSSVSDG